LGKNYIIVENVQKNYAIVEDVIPYIQFSNDNIVIYQYLVRNIGKLWDLLGLKNCAKLSYFTGWDTSGTIFKNNICEIKSRMIGGFC